MMKPTGYFYSGSRAYSGPRPRMFRCDMEPTARRFWGKWSYLYVLQEVCYQGWQHTPWNTRGPQVELKF